jgi:hypothetical protein
MKRPVDTDSEDDEDYVPPSNDHGVQNFTSYQRTPY